VSWLSTIVPEALKGRIRFGIHLRFILIIVLLIMLTSISVSWFFIRREVALIQGNLRQKGETLVRTLAHSSLYPILANSQDMLKTLVRGPMSEEEVIFGLIHDAKGTTLGMKELIVFPPTRHPSPVGIYG